MVHIRWSGMGFMIPESVERSVKMKLERSWCGAAGLLKALWAIVRDLGFALNEKMSNMNR